VIFAYLCFVRNKLLFLELSWISNDLVSRVDAGPITQGPADQELSGHVKSASSHVISLDQYASAYTRGRSTVRMRGCVRRLASSSLSRKGPFARRAVNQGWTHCLARGAQATAICADRATRWRAEVLPSTPSPCIFPAVVETRDPIQGNPPSVEGRRLGRLELSAIQSW